MCSYIGKPGSMQAPGYRSPNTHTPSTTPSTATSTTPSSTHRLLHLVRHQVHHRVHHLVKYLVHHLVHHLLLHLVPHLLETQESVDQGVIYFIILETWQEAAVVYCSVGGAEGRKASAPPTSIHTSIPTNCCTATAGQGKRRG